MNAVPVDNFVPPNPPDHRRKGTVLIVTMGVSFALAVLAMVLCRTMAVEVIAAANDAAAIQADAIERGAEQYVLGLLATYGQQVLTQDESLFAAVRVGDGYFWILRPNYDDPWLPVYGLVDESSKIDLNEIDDDDISLSRLAAYGFDDDELAAAIMDWGSDDTHPGGAKDDYYLSLPEPYYCKGNDYQTVEELLLVRGMTKQLLFGDGTAPPLGETSAFGNSGSPLFGSTLLSRGLYDLFTVNSRGQEVGDDDIEEGLINVNTAPAEVLICLTGLTQADVDALIAARPTYADPGSTSVDWVRQVLGGGKFGQIDNEITGRPTRYSADILAVSGNGRAFKRVRIVIDTENTPHGIVYRRDWTDRGWPMNPEILASLKNGTYGGTLR